MSFLQKEQNKNKIMIFNYKKTLSIFSTNNAKIQKLFLTCHFIAVLLNKRLLYKILLIFFLSVIFSNVIDLSLLRLLTVFKYKHTQDLSTSKRSSETRFLDNHVWDESKFLNYAANISIERKQVPPSCNIGK